MPSDSIALSKNDPVVVACISAIKPSTWPALLIARLVRRASNQGQQQPGVGDGVERRARKLSAAQTRRQERQRAGDRFAAAFLAFTHFPALIASLFQGCHFRSWLCTVAVVRSGPKQHFERDPQRAARTNVTPRCRPSAPPQIVPAAASTDFAVAARRVAPHAMTSSSHFANAFGGLLPRRLRCTATTKVFEIAADTPKTGTLARRRVL